MMKTVMTVGRGLGLALVALCLTVGLIACDRLLSADRRIERAAVEFAAGQYVAAMNDAKTALEAEPDHVEGRVLLARISLRLGDAESARKELDRALLAGADPALLRDLHYDIFLQQGHYQDALLAAAVDEEVDPLRRLLVMGTAQTALGQKEDAGRSIEEALAREPDNRDALLLQARWYWGTGRLDEAGEALDRLIERNPGFAEAWMYKGRFALGAGNAARALAAFEEALKTSSSQLGMPDQFAVHAGIVESRMALADLSGAETGLRALEAMAQNAFVTRYLRARLAYLRGDYPVAVAELQRALSRQPGNPAARLLLGTALIGQGSIEQAESELSGLVAEYPDNVEARRLLAGLYLSRNDAASARRVLANAPAVEVNDPGTDWLTGSVLLASGQTSEAIALLEQGAAANPGNVPLRLDLVRAYLVAGRRADALAALAALPEGEGGLARRKLTVLAEVAGRDAAAARQGIARLVRENSSDAGLLMVAGSFLLSIGDAVTAARTLEQAIAADPRNLNARLALAAATLQGGDLGRGEEHLRKVLELDSTSELALVGLSGVALARGDRAAARQWLERAISADPAVVEARLRLAELALADKDSARMKSMAEQALAVTKNRAQTLNRVGQLLMRASQYDEALARFSEAAELGLDDAGVNAGLALVALGRTDEARARLEAAANRRRDWAAPVAYLAALDSGQGRFDQALARVDALQKAGGAASAADEIRGAVYNVSGDHKAAVAAYERAAKAQPASSLAIKLFRARKAAGVSAPESSLTAWLDENPRDTLVRVLLAEHWQLQGDRKGAIAQYEHAVEISPDPVVLNNLAWLYYEVGDDRATGLARQAYEAAPDNAAIADTYGWILVEKSRAADGVAILEKAAKDAPRVLEIQYHYAVALARTGKRQQAAEALRSLLQATDAFPSRREAEALLRSLSQG